MQDGIVIEYLTGNCPVQAEGTVNGVPFYFRARGARWSIQIAPVGEAHTWEYSEKWGDGPFAAGWMPEDEARRMIEKAAFMYRVQQPLLREEP
jgi:hypothetical protein